jgi:AraC-like DNA-binding protein
VTSAAADKKRLRSSDGDEAVASSASAWSKKFHIRDPDELLHHFNSLNRASYREVVPLGPGSDLSFHKVEFDFGRVRLAQVTCTPLIVRGPGSPRKLLVLVSEQGHTTIRGSRGVEAHSQRGDAAIAATLDQDGEFETSADTRYVLHLDQRDLAQHMEAAEPTEAKAPKLLLRLDFSTPVAASFHRALNYIWWQQGPPNELLRAAYDEILLQGLVSNLAPVVLDGRSAEAADPGSAYIRRACEIIRVRVSEPIRIAEVAAELGISARYLQAGFRRYLGATPHQFLRDCRLDQAHRMLCSAQRGQTATTIAYDCGFGHLGEFAQSYRLRFGESPSETLRRSHSF